MNVFILGTGRCGTLSFINACHAITNYSSAHESRIKKFGPDKLDYPPHHIEADNRLSWFLGRLDEKYGREAFYIHLKRDRNKVISSYHQRWDNPYGIIRAYAKGILTTRLKTREIVADYVETVEKNIEYFLRDKPLKMEMHIENIRETFPDFWEAIGAEGNLSAALESLSHKQNISSYSIKEKLIYFKQRIIG